MCLETVARFNDDRHKCYFNSMTAEDILQKSRLLTMIFVIVAQIFRFIVITRKKKVFIAFIKDV